MAAAASKQSSARPTIGVLVDWLKDWYQSAMFAGLVAAARSRDVNLTVFAGGLLGGPANDGIHRNFVFDLCTARNVDGVVLMAGAIGNHLGTLAIERLAHRLAPLPMVSLAVGLPGVASLLLEEGPGMRQALEHLMVRHGCRRIAFIRGPSVNAEAERRYHLYRAVLEENGVDVDPALVCEGTFNRSAGAAAIKTLLEERRVSFDAVVAGNDIMALAAMRALRERGIEVPSDVAVIGFDDMEAARFATPPLTTIRQPLNEQGALALDLVLAQMNGRDIDAQTLTAAELVIRQSCGCPSGTAHSGRSGPVTRTATTIDALLLDHGDALRQQLVNAVHGADASLAVGWDSSLLEAFQAELRGGGVGLFTATLEGLLGPVGQAGDDVAAWQEVISVLRRLLLPALTGDPARWLLAEDLWHEARVLVAALTQAAQAQYRLNLETLARTLAECSARLSAVCDVPQLLMALAEEFPRLGIPGAWLALFDDTQCRSARLALAYDETVSSGVPFSLPSHDTSVFAADELVPAGARAFDRRFTVAVEPLFFDARPLGFLVLELGPPEGLVYVSLAEQVSSALDRAHLNDELTRKPAR